MSNSRKKRRVTRRADAELQEAEGAFEGGSRLKALQHYQSALGTMRELKQDEWNDEDKIRVMKAYAGILENMPEKVDVHAESSDEESSEGSDSVIAVPNPELLAVKEQAQEFMNAQLDIASLDYFLAKLKLVRLMIDGRDVSGMVRLSFEKYAADTEFVRKNTAGMLQVLEAMHSAFPEQEMNLLLTEKQRSDLADCYSTIAFIHLVALNHAGFLEYFQKFLHLKLNAKKIDSDLIENNIVHTFTMLKISVRDYDVGLRHACEFAEKVFRDKKCFRRPFEQAVEFLDFLDISQFLLRQQHTGMAMAFQVFNIVLDILHSRMQAGAFEKDSPEYFPDNEFKDAMLEPKFRQVFLETREKFQSANALFQRMGRDPAILFSQELEIQRLRQANVELSQRLDLLEKRIIQSEPAQPSAGGMFKHTQVRERDSDKDINPDECKRAKFSG